MKISILDIPFDRLTFSEALERALGFCAEERGHLIVTGNPEMVMLARRDLEFKKILQTADLVLADGAGIVFAARFLALPPLQRIPGVDYAEKLLEECAARKIGVFLLGGRGDAPQKAAENLKKRFPNLSIVGAESGGVVKRKPLDEARGKAKSEKRKELWETDTGILERIQKAAPTVLLVAFGHGKQEKWIVEHLPFLPSARVAIGVGGAFDYWAGLTRRAPRLMRILGLEWLWRLIFEPRRFKRIWTAVFAFPFVILTKR